MRDPAFGLCGKTLTTIEVAFERFVDNVKLQIRTQFLHDLDRDLGFALVRIDPTPEQCTKWLEEDSGVVKLRQELTGKKKRLEAAQNKLKTFMARFARLG